MLIFKTRISFFFLWLALAGCRQKPPDTDAVPVLSRSDELHGKAVRIIDGDTFDLLTDGKKVRRVRLFGIDCPERGQPFYGAAKEELGILMGGAGLNVHIVNTDRYGRSVCIVKTEKGTNVNESLLKTGLTWHYSHYDHNPEWTKLEQQARRARIGIWSDPHPIAPWIWKHGR
jgi:micrococcal nuclease